MSERPNLVLACLLAAAAAFAALVASALSVLGTDGVVGLAAILAGAFSACVFFLDDLARLPLLALALALLATASAAGTLRTIVLYLREQRLLRALPLEPIDAGPLAELARRAGAPRLFVSPARRPAAFCCGLLRPRVVVTAGLLTRLSDEEQKAAVMHEAHHARQREPLKCLLGRLAASRFAWIPVLRDLLDRYLLAKELAADRAAVEATSRRALAGALAEVSATREPLTSVGLADCATARIDRLLDPDSKLPPLLRRSHLLASILAVAALILLSLFPARLELGQTAQLRHMLTDTSQHGLPGMAAGLAANAAMLAMIALAVRRFTRGRHRA